MKITSEEVNYTKTVIYRLIDSYILEKAVGWVDFSHPGLASDKSEFPKEDQGRVGKRKRKQTLFY